MNAMTAEDYAKQHGRLHPTIRQVFQPYFQIDLGTVSIKVVEIIPYKKTVFVIADTIVFKEGALNFEFTQESFLRDGKLWHRSNGAVDLSTDHGVQTLAHELMHCQQWRTIPRWRFFLWYLPGLFRGWLAGRRYAHRYIRWEEEAIVFQKTVKFTAKEHQSFKLLQ